MYKKSTIRSRFQILIGVRILLVLLAFVPSSLHQVAYAQASVPDAKSLLLQRTSEFQKTGGYLIGPEDLLEISVWKEEALQREVLVRPDGWVTFPLAGHVRAIDTTVDALQKEITRRLKKYISDPVVTVSVKTVAGYKIYVIGQVGRSGEYTVGHYVDVMQALALAGGLTAYAAENKIKILRREKGRRLVINFDYGEAKLGRDLKQNIILKRGDVVVVP